ncbi:pirin family protein [Leptospira idonii]|uniref:Pirin family protein n=1 Tax=Leptospira idonii TaxID=1193500 RepID=A0A4R9M0G2_9LEPT|nr:pirin family protein [Leptospira idonii]TGN20204.1 pirin family protein [Leptospira idonii]
MTRASGNKNKNESFLSPIWDRKLSRKQWLWGALSAFGVLGIGTYAISKQKEKSSVSKSLILQSVPLHFQWPTSDPFLFCVHHEDHYPQGNGKFGPKASLSGRDIGQDFEGKDGWRMYHGETIPGFPGHPHRGFETVTVVQKGLVDHADSLGAAGRYGDGDVQWMTAGGGVQHSEMFPLLHEDKENPLELFQIWLNLPGKNKFVPPHFTMLWNESIPVRETKDNSGKKLKVKTVAGSLFGDKPLAPPPNSWAADSGNEVGIYVLEFEENAKFNIPAASQGLNRSLYYFRGEGLSLNGESLAGSTMYRVPSEAELEIQNGDTAGKILILEGKPIGEPVVKYGPFVMNSPEEIQQAFNDYRRTEFGGWPWPSSYPVHKGAGRFAKHADGREETPT